MNENLDHRLRKRLAAHEAFTASYKGWDGLKNGSLLQAAENDGFDVLLSGDQTLQYEQKLTGRRLAIVVLSTVQFVIIEPHLPGLIAAIDSATPGSFQVVECGMFSRKKTEDHQPAPTE